MDEEKIVKTDQVSDEMFTFVKNENQGKIHDEKFKTKPTTFLKDCFKRFCKNKSSVVGAIIIGVLLLGSFIAPLCNPHVNEIHTESSKLLPKLFNAGTGFWDGTVKYKHIAWDFENDVPNGLYKSTSLTKDAIVGEVKIVEETTTNEVSNNGRNGYLRVVDFDVATEETTYYGYIIDEMKFAATDNVTATYVFGTDDNVEGNKLADVKVVLKYGAGTNKTLTLQDWVDLKTLPKDEKGDVTMTFNFAEILPANSIESVSAATIWVYGKSIIGAKSYFLLHSVNFASTNEKLNKTLADYCINDCTDAARAAKDPGSGKFPKGYFRCSGTRFVYKSELTFVDFTYDPYEHVFGLQHNFKIGESEMVEYVDKGWCKYTKFLPESFEKLSNKCPIEKVYEEKDGGYVCDVVRYKYLGYASMPRYLLGSDAQGHDLLTYSMNCLKTSLLVAIITSAICLVIGLIWGSVSGYFGGAVDLVMERVTDILSGVPWVVMMTLIIVLMGNSIVTFAIALIMTGWIGTASLTRTQFYRFRDREYVLACRTLGARDTRLIFKHILPNALGTIVTSSVLMIPGCIFEEASISYLGLGLKGVASFGVLLSENQAYIETFPVLIIFPAIIISLLMISFNLFGNGLRDALNPTLKGGEQ